MIPVPFKISPHLQVTSRYSNSKLKLNELVFRHIFETGQHATRTVLQICIKAAAKVVKGRHGVAPQQDHLGDPNTAVKKKTRGPHGTWTLIGDIRVRFPSDLSSKQTYEQHRGTKL